MQKKTTTRISMTISGPTEDVNQIVGLAMESGILREFKIEYSATPARSKTQTRRPYGNGLKVGDRVVTKYASTHYGTEKGWVGRVQSIKGGRAEILWDDNTECGVASSHLRKL